MSSFIGHGLAAITTYAAVSPRSRPFQSKKGATLWLGWLIAIAWMPDIDYAIPALTMYQNNGMRITHALGSSLLLPIITGVVLYTMGVRDKRLQICCLQGAIAGLSHPFMDFWVGVIGLPLFWPFHEAVITAPIGLLPSAGSPHWQNYYFYANLLVELGIIVPLIIVFLRSLFWRKNKLKLWQFSILIGISVYSLHWSIGLFR